MPTDDSSKKVAKILPRNGHELLSKQFHPYVDGKQFEITAVELDELSQALGRSMLPHTEKVASAMHALTIVVWYASVAPNAREFEEKLLSIQTSARQLHSSLTEFDAAPLIENVLFRLATMQAGIASSQFIDALNLVVDLGARLAENFVAYRDARTWRDFGLLDYLKRLVYVANHAEATMTLPTNGVASEVDEFGDTELARPLLRFTRAALRIGTQKAITAIQLSPHLSDQKTDAIVTLQRYQNLSWRSLTESLRRAKSLTARRQLEAANLPILGGRPPIR
jgi:hypothetical protein